ncbi:hypothetical protein ACP70R_041924 [Stipagrostis hirtigluma subsp. patula]
MWAPNFVGPAGVLGRRTASAAAPTRRRKEHAASEQGGCNFHATAFATSCVRNGSRTLRRLPPRPRTFSASPAKQPSPNRHASSPREYISLGSPPFPSPTSASKPKHSPKFTQKRQEKARVEMDKVLAFSILSASPADIAAGAGVGGRWAKLSWRRSADEPAGQGEQPARAARQKRDKADGARSDGGKKDSPRFALEFDGIDCFETIVSH